MNHHENATEPRPLIFGEVLFDHFPDGRAVMRGARRVKLGREEFDVLIRDCPDDPGTACSPPTRRARYGVELAARIRSLSGATRPNPGIYQDLTDRWPA